MKQTAELEGLFFAALEKSDPAERASFLEEACGENAALRKSVECMLAAHPEVGSFLESSRSDGFVANALNATVDEPTREKLGTIVGPYKLMEEIGAGGFGLVFVAEQQAPIRRKVALKVIKPGMDSREVIASRPSDKRWL
jgi:hypothetical protein